MLHLSLLFLRLQFCYLFTLHLSFIILFSFFSFFIILFTTSQIHYSQCRITFQCFIYHSRSFLSRQGVCISAFSTRNSGGKVSVDFSALNESMKRGWILKSSTEKGSLVVPVKRAKTDSSSASKPHEVEELPSRAREEFITAQAKDEHSHRLWDIMGEGGAGK